MYKIFYRKLYILFASSFPERHQMNINFSKERGFFTVFETILEVPMLEIHIASKS